MITGDLLEFQGRRWIVGMRRREIRLYDIFNEAGRRYEVPDDADKTGEAKVICNPSKEWPLITMKAKTTSIVEVTDIRTMYRLIPMVDWVTGSPGGLGGNFFVNPALGLRLGHILNVTFANGTMARAPITTSFQTIQQKLAKAEAKPKEPKTVFDHMLDDDEESAT